MAEGGKYAAYVSWVTFKNSLDRLGQSMPSRVDKTVFPGMAGGTLVQLLPALKFLDLIRDDGTPTETLHSLVKRDESGRKEVLRQIFTECYKDLFTLDLTSATPAQLSEKMTESYGVTGSTLGKAVRFFLVGASEIGIPLSNYLITAKGTNGGSRRKITRKQKPAPAAADAPPVIPQVSGTGTTSKTVRLETPEMTLTLIVPGNFGGLTSADRKFVFDLMDRLDEYEKKAAPAGIPPAQNQASEEGGDGDEVRPTVKA